MTVIAIGPAGASGIGLDLPPAEMAPTAWSDGLNARFAHGGVGPMLSDTTLKDTAGFQPVWAHSTQSPIDGLAVWLVMGATKAKCFTNDTVTDITRVTGGDYTGQVSDRWSGGSLGGVLIANNGVDVPQAWVTPNAATPLIALANWDPNERAACMRSFKQFLIALDVTKGATRYPTLVKWSHPADPGAVPSSWDETDPTKDAGETPLSETVGACVDCVPMKDVNIIYKEDSVWGMQYVGGAFIFRFYKIFGDWGVPFRDCVTEFTAGKHFAFTGTDLVIHDGNTVQSVATGRMRELLKSISSGQLKTCYTVLHPEQEEVWFCFRRENDGLIAADTAICYDWVEETLTLRDLPDYRFIATGKVDPPVVSGTTWNTVTGTWASKTIVWGSSLKFPGIPRLFALGTEKLVWADAVEGPSASLTLTREQIGVQLRSNAPPDMSAMKFLQRIWPRITGTDGDVVRISLGTSQGVGKPTDWQVTYPYVIGTDDMIDCTLNGRLFAIKVESEDTLPWVLSGFDADVKQAGNQ